MVKVEVILLVVAILDAEEEDVGFVVVIGGGSVTASGFTADDEILSLFVLHARAYARNNFDVDLDLFLEGCCEDENEDKF